MERHVRIDELFTLAHRGLHGFEVALQFGDQLRRGGLGHLCTDRRFYDAAELQDLLHGLGSIDGGSRFLHIGIEGRKIVRDQEGALAVHAFQNAQRNELLQGAAHGHTADPQLFAQLVLTGDLFAHGPVAVADFLRI